MESLHSLWKSVFLLFPEPEFCLMSPVSPYGLLDCPHPTANVDSISLFLRMPSRFVSPYLFAIEHGFQPCSGHLFLYPLHPRILLLAVKVGFHSHHSVDLAFLGI